MAANSSAESDNSDITYDVECVLATRIMNRRRQYLVKWVGYPSNKSTWEPATELNNCSEAVKKFQEKLLQHKKQYPKKKKPTPAPAAQITTKLTARKSSPNEEGCSNRGASLDSATSFTASYTDLPYPDRVHQPQVKRACVKSSMQNMQLKA